MNNNESLSTLPPGINPEDLIKLRRELPRFLLWLPYIIIVLLIVSGSWLYFGSIIPHKHASSRLQRIGIGVSWPINPRSIQGFLSTKVRLPSMAVAKSDRIYSANDLRSLKDLINLEEITIQDPAGFEPGAFEILAELRNLKALYIIKKTPSANATGSVWEVTDELLEPISRSKSIRMIVITDCKITDSGLKHLAKMTKLESLDLSDTAVTDEGLKHLRPLVNLESLYLVGTKVTYDGLAAIQAVLPHFKIAEISRPTTPGQPQTPWKNATPSVPPPSTTAPQ